MNSVEDDLPEVLIGLVRGLVGSGLFAVVTDRRGGMGGRQLVLREAVQTGQSAEIEVLGELGQWTVGLRFGGMDDFYLPLAWRSLIDGDELVIGDLADQVRFLQERRVEAGAVFVALSDVEARLRRLSDTRRPE